MDSQQSSKQLILGGGSLPFPRVLKVNYATLSTSTTSRSLVYTSTEKCFIKFFFYGASFNNYTLHLYEGPPNSPGSNRQILSYKSDGVITIHSYTYDDVIFFDRDSQGQQLGGSATFIMPPNRSIYGYAENDSFKYVEYIVYTYAPAT